jgi:multidrug efflux pump subunit AcrA (membrane-fusion protein)
MRKVFAGLTVLLMLAVVVQFFLAASGAFDTAPKDESFGAHRALGYGLVLFSVLTTVAAALARVPGRLIGMTGLVAVLVIVQGVIRAVAAAVGETATAGQLIFGLHAVNGLVIMALVGRIVRQARKLSRSAASTGDAAGASGSAARPAQPAAS